LLQPRLCETRRHAPCSKQINGSLPTGKRLEPNVFDRSMVAKPYNAFRLADVEMTLLDRPLFHIGDHYVTILGLIAFAGFFTAGLLIARFLQSQIVRRFFSRFKIDTNFIAIVTTILSLAAIVFFTVTAINAAGIPLAWNAALPAIKLSLVQLFLLVALLIAVFYLIQDKAFSF
jgi:hypothetical protein